MSPHLAPPFTALGAIVQQHVDEAAHLRQTRSILTRAPHGHIGNLVRLDERIAAHLDGLLVAGEAGTRLCHEALLPPGVGALFAATVQAVATADSKRFQALLALAALSQEAALGLRSALGWVSAPGLRGVVAGALKAESPATQAIALDACRMHRVDPGEPLTAAVRSEDAVLRSAALRAAGALARVDLLTEMDAAQGASPLAFDVALAHCLLGRPQARVGATAAWRALLEADDGRLAGAPVSPLDRLRSRTRPARALALALAPRGEVSDVLREWAAQARAAPADLGLQRRLILGAAAAGDLQLVPWLIEHMANPRHARLAGEAFTWLTGADLAALGLETLDAPAGAPPSGPSDEPDDDDVQLDEDDSLPWPHGERIAAWWHGEGPAIRARVGQERALAGRTMTVETCEWLLREGTQRLRIHAAGVRAALQPGLGVFPVAAPAWRQRRWLGLPRRGR